MAAAHSGLGQALRIRRDLDGAVAAFCKAIELDPKYRDSYFGLGQVLQQKPDQGGVLAGFRKAIELTPDDPQTWYLLAQAHLTAGDRNAYRQVCADMLKRFGKSKDPAIAAVISFTCLQTPDALDDTAQLVLLAERAASQKKELHVLAAALYRAGKYETALTKFQEAAKYTAPSPWDHLFQAMAYHRLGQADKARASLQEATKKRKATIYGWPFQMQYELLRRETEELLRP
jgi:Flp pilus assembly protein TadD